jgi:acetolactate synthase regulatory subunit
MTDPSETLRLFVEFEIAEGAVVRMLGLIERRGFRVRRVAMAEQPCGRRASLALMIAPMDDGRSVDVLARQLERLHGVRQVTHERMLEAA